MANWLSSAANFANNNSGLITAGLNAIVTASQNKKQRKFEQQEAEKQRLWDEQMAEQQNAWNLEQWNRANEYNTAGAQVERLKEAGLNPLYYGIDGVAAQPMTAAAPLGYDRARAQSIENPLMAGVDSAVKVAQISNIQADTAKKTQETQTEVAKREKILADIAETQQNINNLLAQEGLTKEEKKKLEIANAWADRLNAAVVAESESRTELNKTNKKRIDELLEGEKIIQVKTIQDFDEKWKKIDAEIKKMAAETGLLYEDLANYALNHLNNGFMGTGLSINNLIRGAVAGSDAYEKKGAQNPAKVVDENGFSTAASWNN